MTFEELQKANSEIQTTDIKGKEYAEVNQRIKAFRKLYPDGAIKTSILELQNGVCVMQAFVYDDEEILLATGHAYEKEGSTFINKTSYIENCETSAVGRALGMLGIGIDTSVASFEEVSNAIAQQEEQKKIENSVIDNAKKSVLINLAKEKGVELAKVLKRYKIESLDEMTLSQWLGAMKSLEKTEVKQ